MPDPVDISSAPRRDDTMPGFDDASERQRAEGGEQGTYVPPAPGEIPSGYVRPPALEQFDNATHLEAGPEVYEIIRKILGFEEFADLDGIPFMAVWRRQGKPMMPAEPDERKFAGVEVFDPLVMFVARKLEYDMPRFVVNLYWLHLDELRNESNFVHPVTFERHLFAALSMLNVAESGVLTLGGMTLERWADVVKHYGMVTPGLVQLHRQIALWPAPDEG